MGHVKYLSILLVFTFLINIDQCFGQTIKFNHLTVDDGLSQSSVYSICQDKYGFMWFGTENGLNRYDGITFKIYKNNNRTKNTISNNKVLSLFEDTKNNLWIGTNQGLNCYDRLNDRIIQNPKWPQNSIRAIAGDENNNLWVATYDALYFIDFKNDTLKTYKPNKYARDSGYLFGEVVVSIFLDSKKNVWIGTSQGLSLYRKENNNFINYYFENDDLNSLRRYDVRTMHEDEDGRFWIGTSLGLELFINAKELPLKGKFIHFQHNDTDQESISSGSVLSLLEDNKHNLWIGTENGGLNMLNLNLYNKNTINFIHFRNNPANKYSLSFNSVSSIFQDKQNNIWIGTMGNGINRISDVEKQFTQERNEPENKNSLNNNLVNVFLEDSDYIWIGTEGGLNRYNKKDKTFKHFVHNPQITTSIGSNAVWAICKDRNKNLWVGTWDGGLNLFDYKTETFTHYYKSNNSSSINNNNIFSIIEDSRANIWIGTMGGGLNMYNPIDKTFSTYDLANSNISDNYIAGIKEAKNGDLWLLSANGILRFDRILKNFELFVHKANDSNSLTSKGTLSILEDSKGTIWVGTDAGLNVLQKSKKEFKCYSTSDGLPDDGIKSMLEDAHGNLWLATNKGLSKFVNAVNLPTQPKFVNYSIGDGLQGNEFRTRSSFKGSDGMMYFGGINGYNKFYPDSIKDNPYIPEVVFTEFLLFNKPVPIGEKNSPLKQDISLTQEIRLLYTQSIFTFKFSALNFVAPEKNQYAYIMEGFEKNWNYVGTKREATYTNLEPGKYIFKVKASNNDGVWNEKGTSIVIIVIPPWWKTLWFRMLAITALILAITMFFYTKVAAYKIRQVELTQMVNIRTQELEQTNLELLQERVFIEEQKENLKQTNESLNEQNTRVEEYAEEVNSQNEELKNINDQLLEQQTQIIEQSEELKAKNEQLLLQQVQIEEKSEELRAHAENLKEVNDLLVDKQRFIQLQSDKLEESNRELLVLNSTKDRFFSIIAHDLRNPFHAVSGFSEILLRDYKKLPPEKVERFLTLINKSSVNGGNLLENLLQWSRAQTGKISFEPNHLPIIGIVNNVVDLLEGEAQRKNIEIVEAIEPEMMAFVDENMLKTILRNLISNAIKFTPEKGTITIKALEKFPLLEISIIDTGVGISPQQMQLLFNVETNISTKGTASESGTGLGLILCKEFVEKIGGTIWVESEVGKGSAFIFTLPLG